MAASNTASMRASSSAARGSRRRRARRAASGGGGSYLDMWRKAVERERRSEELARRLQAPPAEADAPAGPPPGDVTQRRTARFEEMLRVPREERDRVQRHQVIDRAAAALAAAQAVLKEPPPAPSASPTPSPPPPATPPQRAETGSAARGSDGGSRPAAREPLAPLEEVPDSGGSSYKQSSSKLGTPGPDFWSWLPPVQDSSQPMETSTGLKPSKKLDSFSHQPDLLMEKEQSADYLSLPFETDRSFPPFQSFVDPDNVDSKADLAADTKETFEVQFSKNAAEAARILSESNEKSSHGIHPDGSMWWKETGVEQRPDGVVCKWTVIRGVSADGAVEWEDKYWEASDRFDHKELGSEKSGRDAAGLYLWGYAYGEDCGQVGTECLDPNTPLDAGHAHVWHERWGEKYDGFGGSTKYTDKWAERSEGDGWSKWGDKWDEHFDQNGHGTKQGETWWAGKYGDRWNRTWGEQHNGSGWVHKYGRSSSGEHWDTHVPQETWYERYPHFGFYHCFENSVQLRSVRKQQPPRK
ncbi:hypothetical protein U9M48_002048 [Paspalum notatum var. saurae]|uniref:Uncharacterized protein n=1 Tax=Paspalum notatum var. saurae TaxID=547442 RepID=A0AAQ3PPM7_PASNO